MESLEDDLETYIHNLSVFYCTDDLWTLLLIEIFLETSDENE